MLTFSCFSQNIYISIMQYVEHYVKEQRGFFLEASILAFALQMSLAFKPEVKFKVHIKCHVHYPIHLFWH